MKNYCSFDDISEIKEEILTKALSAKTNFLKNKDLFKSKGRHLSVGLVFFNPSLRTRISSQKAASNLGMDSVVINIQGDSWNLEFDDGVKMNGSSAEHIKEAAAVLGRYFDILAVRSFADLKNYDTDKSEKVLNGFIKYSGVPVINLESPLGHPLQALADIMTIKEFSNRATKPKVVLTWAPHCRALPQAVANSFSNFTLGYELDLTIAHPAGFDLEKNFTNGAKITNNQEEAFENADFIYAKNWSSVLNYGEIGDYDAHKNWTIDTQKMLLTNNAKFMHCLPVRRNLVVTDEVLDSANSVCITQAENRIWAAQTIFEELINEVNRGN